MKFYVYTNGKKKKLVNIIEANTRKDAMKQVKNRNAHRIISEIEYKKEQKILKEYDELIEEKLKNGEDFRVIDLLNFEEDIFQEDGEY